MPSLDMLCLLQKKNYFWKAERSFYRLFQTPREKRNSIGKISSLPNSISRLRVSIEIGEKKL